MIFIKIYELFYENVGLVKNVHRKYFSSVKDQSSKTLVTDNSWEQFVYICFV